jgi:hypothetical protein
MNENDRTLIFLIPFMLLAIWGIFPSLRQLFRALLSRRWPIAQATMDSATFGQLQSGKFNAPYVAAIAYSFSIDGHPYLGMFVLQGRSDAEIEIKTAARALMGGTVAVRYAPTNPKISLLCNFSDPRFGRLRVTQAPWTLKIAPNPTLGDALR